MIENYPPWAQTLAQKYLSRTVNQFILHGNVHDLVAVGEEEVSYTRLKSFLAEEFFGARDFVIFYDRSSGIYFRDQASREDFNRALAGRDTLLGTDYSEKLPKDPVGVFSLLEQYFRIRLGNHQSVAFIINYAETIVPAMRAGTSGSEDRTSLVYLSRWARDPLFLASDFTTVLISENLSDINKTLIQNPYVATIKIEMPGANQRRQYINREDEKESFSDISKVSKEIVVQQTAGLNIINLRGILADARENENTITFANLNDSKKQRIEAEAHGLLEFVANNFTLDDVAGNTKVKNHLRNAAQALKNGRRDVLPMGYLVCGSVGTGKTFMVTCFSNEIGVPMVKLKNFRSQWQGVTEGNLEKILELLRAMAPVAVMIDEADAYLGNRNLGGDSGVSRRVFSQISSFMSDTRNRGRILWFLMTARPDLMPVDLKRQGRAEEHLPLFPPQSKQERIDLFEVIKRKTKLSLSEDYIPDTIKKGDKLFTGADMEAALTRAKFRAAAVGKNKATPEILDTALNDFLPPTYPEEVELQTLSAVIECTSQELLPEKYRKMNRSQILTRINEIKRQIS
jgi:SpoVK/Ycf46/Vps4 family AAA+-type ATPase